ncbi:hypothetical protein AURDEDRAFT_55616 [Auricularia subglabra TFB-10046 SS5]|nr:hypothetical protein AURDEDRAFT_55616 [Auricularia subglabra TFB-10046 SS5]
MQAPWIHRALCLTGGAMADTFYHSIHVDGEEHVPEHGVPLIVVSSHHNQIVDICVLSRDFPHKRRHSYWAKSSLFKNPVAGYILRNSGNIPVDRRQNDNQKLLKGSFEILKSGEALALFAEGTSYTYPRIVQVKDGASWAALEYSKWRKENGGKPAIVIPVSMVYTDKSQFRSSVVKRHVVQPPVNVTAQPSHPVFATADAEGQKGVVKRLTRLIEQRIVELTINAADWDTYYVALIARQILWKDDARMPPADFVHVSQTIVDLFCTESHTLAPHLNIAEARNALVAYYALLDHVGTSHDVLTSVHPLPSPSSSPSPQPVPSKRKAALAVLRTFFAAALHLPPFIVPMLLNAPSYLLAMYGARLALKTHEIEAVAQNKIIFGLIGRAIGYTLFVGVFRLLGGAGSWTRAFTVCAVAVWAHGRLVEGNYRRWKRLVAAWRTFRGVCAVPLAKDKLAPYLVPYMPPPNPFVLKSAVVPPYKPAPRPPRIPSVKLIAHLFRARAQAVGALAKVIDGLQSAPGVQVAASAHLARQYGARYDKDLDADTQEISIRLAGSTREAVEVLQYLRARGARFPGSAGHGQ